MNILVSCNDAYMMPLLVMLTSLFSTDRGISRYALGRVGVPGKESMHTVYLMESGLSDAAFEKVRSLSESFGACCERMHIPADPFADARTRAYISSETYYRLLAAELLPESLERILWLDADIIVRNDLRAFYERSFEGKAVVACGYGAAMQELIGRNARAIRMKAPERYFNAGVMLINLSLWRRLMTRDRILRLLKYVQESDSLFPGQDLTNLLLDGCVLPEDYRRYNCLIHCISGSDDLQYAVENAAVVHFSGEAKPWKFYDIHFADEWLCWYRKCFGEGTEPKRMSYFHLKALFEGRNNAKA